MKKTKPFALLEFALLAYMLFITVVITLLPFRFYWPDRPIVEVWRYTTLFDVVTNVFLFFPIGFLYQLVRRKRNDRWCLYALGLGLQISFVIELTQIFMRGRYSSLTDLLANGLGAWCGALLYERINKRLNERLVGQLALELPLMNLFYLLVPLLWLHGLAVGDEPSRLWLSPILGLFGGCILASVWIHRLKPAGILSPNTLAVAVAVWFLLSAIPGFVKWPIFLALCGLCIAVFVRIFTIFPGIPSGGDRRFEMSTLLRIFPIYVAYLLLLALWPWPGAFGKWQSSLGFDEFASSPEVIPTLRLVEYVVAFTLLGYMVAESRGRREEPFLLTMMWVLLCCLVSSSLLELARGFHVKHIASLAQLIVTTGAGLYGGAVYRLQLTTVRRLLAKDAI